MQEDLLLRARARLEGKLAPRDIELLELRIERWLSDLDQGLELVFGEGKPRRELLRRVIDIICERQVDRPAPLRRLDLERQLRPDWFQQPGMVGYVCYVDRFAGSLPGLLEHIDYLESLGVSYLHLMPLLRPREGENDGGYAVASYEEIDPRLGTMEDLEAVATALRQRGISLCLDVVINHVAREHAWARRAREGDAKYQSYFWMFERRDDVDRWEETLPEVFPDFSPGNFVFDEESRRWVWTTFNDYQWDLRWENPDVFVEFLDLILALANRGVDVFRLDAVAFIWKRMGTDCQNQPEVHALVQALRTACRIAAPAIIFKAEAIVAPHDLIHYLGRGRHYGKVSDIAYHNSLMVQVWSSLASRDTRLMTQALRRFPAKPSNTAWATYLRCHDDIGWAIADEDAAAVGWNGAAHRAFLADYYSGAFPGSHARGEDFQSNPRTGDRRTSGTAASLAGLETALEWGDPHLIGTAIERLLLAHAVILSFDGFPLLYMGDELGLFNDGTFRRDPDRSTDNRWMHRPAMPWSELDELSNEWSVKHRLFTGMSRLLRARRRTPQLHGATPLEVLEQGNPAILAHLRRHPLGNLVALHNFSEQRQVVDASLLHEQGVHRPFDMISEAAVSIDDWCRLEPYGRLWLIETP